MKISLTKLSSSLILITLSMSAWSKPVAQVTEVTGTVFALSEDGKTTALKVNEHLEDKSEIMVEEGASVTINDYYDATYHLVGGSHLKFFNKSVQLKKGKAWIQSMSSRHPLALTTANGHVSYWKGEFITTFDQGTSKSQVLVVNGEVEVSNILDKNMKYTVPAGTFTVVDPEIENGTPRSPTRVGLQSLNEALAEFKKIPQKSQENSAPIRAIASVGETPVKKGEIIFIKSNRLPASVASGAAHNYYKKVAGKKDEVVPVKIYGIEAAAAVTTVTQTPRTPASVPASSPQLPTMGPNDMKNDPEFLQSLKMHEVEQPKFPKELDNLIQDLKSY